MTEFFCGICCEKFVVRNWEDFSGRFFLEEFLGGFFWEEFNKKLLNRVYFSFRKSYLNMKRIDFFVKILVFVKILYLRKGRRTKI